MAEVPTISLDISREDALDGLQAIKRKLRDLKREIGTVDAAMASLNSKFRGMPRGGAGGGAKVAGGGGGGGVSSGFGAGALGGFAATLGGKGRGRVGGRGTVSGASLSAAASTQKLGIAIAGVNDKAREASGRFAGFKNRLNETGQTIRLIEGPLGETAARFRTFGQIVKEGRVATIAFIGTLATLAISLGAGVVAAARLEQALIGVRKTTNLTDEEISQISDNFLDMSNKLGVARTRMAEFATAAGQMGVQGVENITKFAETMTQLSVATDLTGAQGARALSRIISVSGEANSKVDELGNVLVALGNSLPTIESRITEMAVEVAGAGAQFGFTSEQATALGAAFDTAGVRAATAGTSTTRVMQEINNILRKGGRRAQLLSNVFGQSLKQLRENFEKDAFGVFARFIKRLRQIQEGGTNTTTVLESLGIAALREAKSISKLVGASGNLEEAIRKMKEQMKEQNAAAREAGKATEALIPQLKRVGTGIVNLFAEIGEPLQDPLTEATRNVADFFGFLSKEAAKAEGTIEKILGPNLMPLEKIDVSGFQKKIIPAIVNVQTLETELMGAAQAADMFSAAFSRIDLLTQLRKSRQRAVAMAQGGSEALARLNDKLRIAEKRMQFFNQAVEAGLDNPEKMANAFARNLTFVNDLQRLEERRLNTNRLIEDIKGDLASAEKKLRKETEKTADASKEVGQALETAFQNAIFRSKSLADVLDALSKKLLSIMAFGPQGGGGLFGGIFNDIGSMFSSKGSGGLSKSDIINTAQWSRKFLPGLADGGTAKRNEPHIVGERGPEMFVPGQTGQVVPNGKIGGTTVNQEINIQTGLPAQAVAEARRAGAQAAQEIVGEIERQKAGIV